MFRRTACLELAEWARFAGLFFQHKHAGEAKMRERIEGRDRIDALVGEDQAVIIGSRVQDAGHGLGSRELCRRANKESTEVRSMPQLFAMR